MGCEWGVRHSVGSSDRLRVLLACVQYVNFYLGADPTRQIRSVFHTSLYNLVGAAGMEIAATVV